MDAAVRSIVAAVAVLLTSSAASAQESDVDDGRAVFEANCAMCHGQDASGMSGMHPSLRGAVERLSREGVDVTIRKGRDVLPPMPAFEGRLSDEEISDVVAYLDGLPVGPRNYGGDGGMMGDMDGMMSGMERWWPAVLSIVALAVLIVAGVVFARARRGHAELGQKARAQDILDERYARGDIDHDEYRRRSKALRGK